MTEETKNSDQNPDANEAADLESQPTTGEPVNDAEPAAEQETGEMQKYKAQAEEYLLLLQRVQADFDNFRRRSIQEREDAAKYCSLRLATGLLPVLDNFERALQAGGDDGKSLRDGVELIYKQLRDVLEKEGIKPMESVGTQFDPNLHEAVMQEASNEHPDNSVTAELQKGYQLLDRVIRPAMVKVAKS